MTEPLVFVLPLPVNLGNARTHWAAKHKAKKAYWEVCDLLLMAGRLPRPPLRGPFTRARLDTEQHHTHETDDDNRSARQKWCRDWLKTRGYIVDDSDAHLECTPVRPVRCRKVSERKLVLTLTPLSEAA